MSLIPIEQGKNFLLAIIVGILLSSFNVPVYAEEDPYLKALESEAAELKDFDPPADSAPVVTDSSSAGNENDAASSKERQFAERLHSSLPNTYLIYKKLSETQKGLVVEAYYVNDQSMAEASRQIFNIYFKKIN